MNFSSLHFVVIGEAKVREADETSVQFLLRFYCTAVFSTECPMDSGLREAESYIGLFQID